jgi:hypothetical protein
MYKFILAFFVIVVIVSCQPDDQVIISTLNFHISIDKKGNVNELVDKRSGTNFKFAGQNSPFLSIRVNHKILNPSSLVFEKESDQLVFYYDSVNVEARVKVESKDSHLTFELLDIQPKEDVELVIWGPYPTTINKSIGETVGVVRGEKFAMGIQALNPKTLGGYPWNENDCMPQIDIFEGDDYSDLSEEGKRYVLYRVEAAKPEDFGSTLQAYCRNRSEDRIIENWQHQHYLAPAYDDGGVIGSKIALFGCPVEETLNIIGKIEIAENLPHPMIDGEWGKQSTTANASYLIMNFGEEDIERAIKYTKQAGLKYVYHSGPFKTWGHFELNEQFPNGLEGLKSCVDIAEKEGLYMGVHTLSNFITTNDVYVTPIPDERLAKVGFSEITSDIDNKQKEIEIEAPDVFNQLKNNNLKTVVIGEELIRYGAVSKNGPWKLLDCQRGAFETTPSNHKVGEKIALLADHAYKVFLTDADLTKEVAINLAEIYNQTGLRQISFDGLEGNRSTGMGNYGEILMTTTWYDHLEENIKSNFIADASRTSHYFWHIYSRMNWGEPWYAGFRESQTEYRFKNQKYFERNLMPGMLGWFLMTEQTTLEDIEWMLAKAAGYNAGFGFVSSYKAFENNGMTDEILQQINIWENARLEDIFDEKTREKLRDINMEFHLEKTEDGNLNLIEIQSFIAEHTLKEKQPGEPLHSTLAFNNEKEQDLNFIITAVDGKLKDIILEVDNYKQIAFMGIFEEGDIIKYSGGKHAVLYNKNWQLKRKLNCESSSLNKGDHMVTLDCKFPDEKAKMKMEVRLNKNTSTIESK